MLKAEVMAAYHQNMRMIGVSLVGCLYFLVGLHCYAFFGFMLGPLKRRLGEEFTLLWIGIGLALLYNVWYNHFLAMLVKPGSPADLKNVEQLRQEQKQRKNRKEVD
jgi:hypothetical protein